MKRIYIVAMLCLVVAVSVVSATGANAPIGVDTAKGKAQDFLNAPDATVQYQKTERLNLGEYYVFGTGDGQVYVNARTGAVERATFDSARKDSRDVRLDRAAAEATARAYAEEKYSGFAKKNMQLTRSDLVSHGDAGSEYSYIWREEISGVLTPNTVVVNLNPSTGEIVSYIGIQREIKCSLEPKLSRDEALKIAAGQFPGIRVGNPGDRCNGRPLRRVHPTGRTDADMGDHDEWRAGGPRSPGRACRYRRTDRRSADGESIPLNHLFS